MRYPHPGVRALAFQSLLALALLSAGVAVSPSRAQLLQTFENDNSQPLSLDEIRLGAYKQAIDDAPGEGSGAVNLEVLFGRLQSHSGNGLVDHFLSFRPHIGATVSVSGDTNMFYAGATWDLKLTDWAFVETSFGGAVHDGPLDEKGHASYGCTANFRESASLGFKLSEDWRLLATIEHMSNAGLCEPNRGLTNAGLRLGYKF